MNVGSTLANGTYGVGTVIPITVTFNGSVTVDTTGGTPTLTLALEGGKTVRATYARGSGTTRLGLQLHGR